MRFNQLSLRYPPHHHHPDPRACHIQVKAAVTAHCAAAADHEVGTLVYENYGKDLVRDTGAVNRARLVLHVPPLTAARLVVCVVCAPIARYARYALHAM